MGKAPPVAAGGALLVHYRPGIPGAAVEVESGTDADAGVKTSAPLVYGVVTIESTAQTCAWWNSRCWRIAAGAPSSTPR